MSAQLLPRAGERDLTEKDFRRYSERLRVLHEIDRAALAADSPQTIAEAALEYVGRLACCQGTCLGVFDFDAREATVLAAGDGRGPAAGTRLPLDALGDLSLLWQGEVDLVQEVLTAAPGAPGVRALPAAGGRSCLSVPLIVRDNLIGALRLTADRPGAFSAELIDVAGEVADRLAVVLQATRLAERVEAGRERLTALAGRARTARESERRRLGRELHDEVGQALTAVKINLQTVQRLPASADMAPRLDESVGLVEQALHQVRSLSLELSPPLLDGQGLGPALRSYLNRLGPRAGLAVLFAADPLEKRLPGGLETACFRVVQEALTNVVRHARARQVAVEVRRRARAVRILVADDGVGFDVRAAWRRAGQGSSLGLLGMRERVLQAGGRIAIRSAPGRGTEVRARLPLPPSRATGAGRRRTAG
jgi:signal transduction histidine kinase